VAVQGRGTADDPSEFRAAAADPPVAGCHSVPDRSWWGADRGEAAGEKLLEDAQIKLSVVASDIFGVSGREMLAALVGGQTNPQALAQLARGRLRAKLGALQEAFTGHFTDHHDFLLGTMLARIDALDADIAALDAKIEEIIAPFARAVEKLDEIPGVGITGARVIIAEVGVDMSQFPTAAHLSSWARFAPGVKESAGRKKGRGTTGHGNRYLARVLGKAAVTAGKTDTFLGERYRRIAKRRSKKRAIVAVGRSILIIVWHRHPRSTVGDSGSPIRGRPASGWWMSFAGAGLPGCEGQCVRVPEARAPRDREELSG
jgi:Transposase IS116/IS110/IS902 family